MKHGTIAAAFAAGLTLGVALPLAGQVLLQTLRQGAQGVERGNFVHLFCTEIGGAIIPGSKPIYSEFNGQISTVSAWAVHVRCE